MSNLLRNHNIQRPYRISFDFPGCNHLYDFMQESGRRRGEGVYEDLASPQETGAALLKAAKSGDQASLLEIFGPDGKEILFTGDAASDQTALKDFAAAYETMNRWGKIAAGGEMLFVGADNLPFPVPLEKDSSGQWYFDTAERSG